MNKILKPNFCGVYASFTSLNFLEVDHRCTENLVRCSQMIGNHNECHFASASRITVMF